MPPIHMPFFFEAAILSRTRSAITSRSNWANERRMFSVSRPMLVVVLNCWVIETNDTPWRSKTSTNLANLKALIPEADRAALAAALEAVDAVTLFDEETPRQLVAALLPDVLVKGADWSHFIAGREEVEASGGKVVAIPLQPGYSTTNIVERILA